MGAAVTLDADLTAGSGPKNDNVVAKTLQQQRQVSFANLDQPEVAPSESDKPEVANSNIASSVVQPSNDDKLDSDQPANKSAQALNDSNQNSNTAHLHYATSILIDVQKSASSNGISPSTTTTTILQTESFEASSNFLSRVFLWWMFVPLFLGQKKQLVRDDLGQPKPSDDPVLRSVVLKQAFKETKSLRKSLWILIGWKNFLMALILAFGQAGFSMAVPYLTQLLLESLAGADNLSTGGKVGVTFAVSLLPLLSAM